MTTTTDGAMAPRTRALLERVSTATLTTVLFKRGFRNVFIQGIAPLGTTAPRMVGPAYTLRYIPAREDLDHLGVFEDRGHPQRRGVEECPPGHVFVIDSRGDRTAASAGGILVTRLLEARRRRHRDRRGIPRLAGDRRPCRSRPTMPDRRRRPTSSSTTPPT